MRFKALTFIALSSTTVAAPALLLRTTNPAWSIRNFTRNCINPNVSIYQFAIDTNDGSTPTDCTVVDDTVNATTHSFYNLPCDEVSVLLFVFTQSQIGHD